MPPGLCHTARPVMGNQERPGFSVVWTRGKGCREVAELLSEGDPTRVEGDLAKACVDQRAELLVGRRMTSFDLVSVAVPNDLDLDKADAVVGGIGGGPHSLLVARIAARLASVLDLPATLATSVASSEEAGSSDQEQHAAAVLGEVAEAVPGMEVRVLADTGWSRFAAALSPGALLVLGAPGGSFLDRALFGPGRRLRAGAPAGAVIVREAPTRVFHRMGDPVFVGPFHPAGDTLRLHQVGTLAVAEHGLLLGMVTRRALERAAPSTAVGDVMESARSVRLDQPLSEVVALAPDFGPDPIPVVDEDGRLVGGLVLDAA
jgi:CBS domain-containing protein